MGLEVHQPTPNWPIFFFFWGGQDRHLVNEAPHTLVQHLSPMCQVHPSLDLGLPRLVQGEPVHIEQYPKGPLSWYGLVLLGTVQYGQVSLEDG